MLLKGIESRTAVISLPANQVLMDLKKHWLESIGMTVFSTLDPRAGRFLIESPQVMPFGNSQSQDSRTHYIWVTNGEDIRVASDAEVSYWFAFSSLELLFPKVPSSDHYTFPEQTYDQNNRPG